MICGFNLHNSSESCVYSVNNCSGFYTLYGVFYKVNNRPFISYNLL